MKNKSLLDQALESITVEMLEELDYSEELELNENYTLYHYCEDDIVVVNELPNWDEIFQVLWDSSTKEITFEKV